jgi:hypothetical protein
VANPFFIPRHDYVLVRYEEHGKVGELHVPGTSAEAGRYLVVRKGPDCKPGVEPGDTVIIGGYAPLGHAPQILFQIPGVQKTFLTKDANIIAVRKKGED